MFAGDFVADTHLCVTGQQLSTRPPVSIITFPCLMSDSDSFLTGGGSLQVLSALSWFLG